MLARKSPYTGQYRAHFPALSPRPLATLEPPVKPLRPPDFPSVAFRAFLKGEEVGEGVQPSSELRAKQQPFSKPHPVPSYPPMHLGSPPQAEPFTPGSGKKSAGYTDGFYGVAPSPKIWPFQERQYPPTPSSRMRLSGWDCALSGFSSPTTDPHSPRATLVGHPH